MVRKVLAWVLTVLFAKIPGFWGLLPALLATTPVTTALPSASFCEGKGPTSGSPCGRVLSTKAQVSSEVSLRQEGCTP